MQSREVKPEWLDSLAPDHPDAIASRRELRWLNAIMGNFRWIERTLESRLPREGGILEIGAGDGGLALRLIRRHPRWRSRLTALDRVPRPPSWPDGSTWLQADLWSPAGECAVAAASVVCANLFLHHFDDSYLARLGRMLRSARLLVFSEPSRRRIHLWQGALMAPILNRVTRHDLPVSIRAGFRAGELPSLLNLASSWTFRECGRPLGAFRLVGWRP